MGSRSISYEDLAELARRTAAELAELKRDNVFIRRQAATSAPTELDPGTMQLVDTGAAQSIAWASPSGIVSAPLT